MVRVRVGIVVLNDYRNLNDYTLQQLRRRNFECLVTHREEVMTCSMGKASRSDTGHRKVAEE